MASLPDAVARALRVIRAHPEISEILSTSYDPDRRVATIGIGVRVSLPNAWRAAGRSPNGVLAQEPVRLEFTDLYPLKPPKIFLRTDFDRSLPHINPIPAQADPGPCVLDGNLGELLQQQGLAGILNQLVEWLNKAAMDALIDPNQGWEPMRRDEVDNLVVADPEHVRALVRSHEGHAFVRIKYARIRSDEKFVTYVRMTRDVLQLNPEVIDSLLSYNAGDAGPDSCFGDSMAVCVWPGSSQKADQYQPETVKDIASLRARAREYGCLTPLLGAFDRLGQCLKTKQRAWKVPLLVVLYARRPFSLIGSDSPIELCPYLVDVDAPLSTTKTVSTPVDPVAHRDAIAVPLLRRMSGDEDRSALPWVLVGAGSLGSKIALHLARAGRAPVTIIDRSNLSPHNAARHALLPTALQDLQLSWMGPKAKALAQAIELLEQKAEPVPEDAIQITRDATRARKLFGQAWAIVNSTASLAVREAFASLPPSVSPARVIETSLFGLGRVGLISAEGVDRNPNTGDLVTLFYSVITDDPDLRAAVFSEEARPRRYPVGVGCSSETILLSDARISLLAAPMAEIIRTWQKQGLARHGQLMIGTALPESFDVRWLSLEAAPWQTCKTENGWSVRISPHAHERIRTDVGRHPRVETGGILLGRVSEAARTFHVVDVLEAPPDSKRSASEFILGTNGVRAELMKYVESSARTLYSVGTWHSHLRTSGPSATDRATGAVLAGSRLISSVMLIHTPGGYRAFVAEAAD